MKIFKYLPLLCLFLCTLVSCSETDEAQEYDNWQQRNVQFIDSIASVARANADGTWKVLLATGLDPQKDWGNEYYVYCKVEQAGTGEEHPISTSTVSVNYSGRLIPTVKYPEGYIFDASYSGELDPDFDVPVEFALSGTIAGFRLAIENMVAGTTNTDGDIWRVYIPSALGYGSASQGGIPAYSALIFDINLVSFVR